MNWNDLSLLRFRFRWSLGVVFLVLLAFACSAHGQAVKIMTLGDSMTSGYRQYVSYRYDLWFQLMDAGFDVDFVGGNITTDGDPNLDLYPNYLTTFDREHQAYSGYRTDQLVGIARVASTSYQPDIVLLWAGVNDIWEQGAGGVVNARIGLRDIIGGIRAVVPGVTILLGQITPYEHANSEYVVPLNDEIAVIASELDNPGSPVILVDHYTGFNVGSMTWDNVHQNRTGETWVADNWFEVLASILPGSEPFSINIGHSGAWYNPDTSGQGQLIDVEPESQFIFLAWFTFTDAASDNPNEQHWFTAQGNYSGNTADLIVSETLGGRFDDPQEADTNPVGLATLIFEDCSLGYMYYTIDTLGLQGSFPLQRAIPGAEKVCEEETGNSDGALVQNDGWDGAWYDPATPGQGFLIDAKSNAEGDDFIFVAWFTYGEDTASEQRWLTAQGPFQGVAAEINVSETKGGSFDDPTPSETNPVGAMTIDFVDCSNAILTYSINDESLNGMIDITRAIPGTEALCQELTDSE